MSALLFPVACQLGQLSWEMLMLVLMLLSMGRAV